MEVKDNIGGKVMKRKCLIAIALILALVVLATGCKTDSVDSSPTDLESTASKNTEDVLNSKKVELYFDKELPDVVMIINGEEIHKEQLLAAYEQMKTLYKSVGIDIESTEVQKVMQEALLSNTISSTVLKQEADKAGITISDAQVREKIKQIMSQYSNEEEFNKMLSQLDNSLEDLEERIRNQLKISKLFEENLMPLIESNTSLNFSDEEKKEMYEAFSSKVGGMPDYEDMKEEIDEMLEDNKVQIIVGDYIQNLVDNSEIELFLE